MGEAQSGDAAQNGGQAPASWSVAGERGAPPGFLTRVKHFADNLTPQYGARHKSETVARPMSGYGSESDAPAFN